MYSNGCSEHDIQRYLISQIATTCGLPIAAIRPNESLFDLGIDSLIAAEINLQIEKTLGIEFPFSQMSNEASIANITQCIVAKLQENKHPLSIKNLDAELLSDENHFKYIALEPKPTNDIRSLPEYKKIKEQKSIFEQAQMDSVYFKTFDSASTDIIRCDNRELINFSSYNYLGFVDDPRVNAAANRAISQFGTSAASSRIVSGEKRIHVQLEAAIAELYEVESAIVFVSGYATNVSVISHLMRSNDLIIHDSLSHNSIVMGSEFSKAQRLVFPHNNMEILESLLKENRHLYDRVLIVVEGLYSMDGDTAPLTEIVALKKQYKCLLMVDEAHSLGVLGEHGLGLREHCRVAATDVDIWMGTLSKSLAGCGGYIAGCSELIEYLKFSAPGFIFSVALAPPLAAASLEAIELLKNEPYRVKKLQQNSQYFLSLAKERGLDTGLAEGYAIVPVILRHSLNTAKLAQTLFQKGINVQPIMYPGVDEQGARLRFFISSLHSESQIKHTVNLVTSCFSLIFDSV